MENESSYKLSPLPSNENMKKITFIILTSLFLASCGNDKLPNCPSDTMRWNNCFGTYTTASGDLYIGEFKDDEYHGQGTYTWINGPNRGDEYFGEFKGSILHGQGTYTYANGDKYVGEFKDDKGHGQGTFTFANGTKQVGYYMNDDFVPNICEGMGLSINSSGYEKCINRLIDEVLN